MSEPCRCNGYRCGASNYNNRGCRCDYCRADHAARTYRARKRREARPIPPTVRHGRAATYVNWGCRCHACAEAWSVVTIPRNVAWRARQRQQQTEEIR